ncbi:hypothetical protein FRC03_012966 [Tulasnella sp. 419]|nr:hypothetical protein FRC03_012966 [Tulasnella sp. 419]
MLFSKTSILLAVGAAISLLPSMASATFWPIPDDACRNGKGIMPLGLGHKDGPERCKCIKFSDFWDGKGFKEYDLKDGCHAYVKKPRWGIPYCHSQCPTHKRNKREQERILNPDGSLQVCAKPSVACPIAPTQDGPSKTIDSIETECVFPQTDLENCGGCSSLGQGMNCAAIEGVKSTTCVTGQCQVFSCRKGYKLIPNPAASHHKRTKASREASPLPAKICVPEL